MRLFDTLPQYVSRMIAGGGSTAWLCVTARALGGPVVVRLAVWLAGRHSIAFPTLMLMCMAALLLSKDARDRVTCLDSSYASGRLPRHKFGLLLLLPVIAGELRLHGADPLHATVQHASTVLRHVWKFFVAQCASAAVSSR